MTKMQELQADAKLVYNGTLNDLVDLAAKYNVTTRSLSHALVNPSDAFASIGVQAFKSKGDEREIRSKLYATIKGQMR